MIPFKSKSNEIVLVSKSICEIPFHSITDYKNLSTRVKNSLKRAQAHSLLPFKTIGDYITCPERQDVLIKSIEILGLKSAEELDEAIIQISKTLNRRTDKKEYEKSLSENKLITVCKSILEGLEYPYVLENEHISKRVSYVLSQTDGQYTDFAEFVANYYDLRDKILDMPNCGHLTANELREKSIVIIKKRLEKVGLSKEHGHTIFSLMSGDEVTRENKIKLVSETEGIEVEHLRSKLQKNENPHYLDEYIEYILQELKARECDVIKRRYGLAKFKRETLEVIAKDYNVTRERVRQIGKSALSNIATSSNKERLRQRIEEEELIKVIFSNRKIIPQIQTKLVWSELSGYKKIAIELVYGNIENFLNKEAINDDAGWFLDEELVEEIDNIEDFDNSLRTRLVKLIHNSNLPIRLEDLDKQLPDYPRHKILSEMEQLFDAKFENGVIVEAPRLPASTRFVLILRHARRRLHCNEIRSQNCYYFGRDDSIHYIGSVLSRLLEVLIVGRGTYTLYENLLLTKKDIKEICDRAHTFLIDKGEYISTKAMFTQLFQGETERFGSDFDYMMLLGILQDDERFDVRRGYMVGLESFGPEQGFVNLKDEIKQIIQESQYSVSVRDIKDQLEGRRELFETTITASLESIKDVVQIRRGRYDLVDRVIGDEHVQDKLNKACIIALINGPKSTLALSELLENLGYQINARTLHDFLVKQEGFDIRDTVINVNSVPEYISKYDAVLELILNENSDFIYDAGKLSQAIISHGAYDLTKLDPRPYFGREKTESSNDGSMLNQLLEDFDL